MQYFSIYDILLDYIKEHHISIDDMYAFFKKNKISKSAVDELQRTIHPTNEKTKQAILSFLGITEIELDLMVGYIPHEYRESYYKNINKIASLLEKSPMEQHDNIPPYYVNTNGKLYNSDCIQAIKMIPNNSVDLVFADPPFNIGKQYDPGVNDNLSVSKYINWTYTWLDECIRVLKPGGRLFVYNLPKWCIYIAHYLDKHLTFWDWIAIDMKYTLPIRNRLYPSHYALVSFIKGPKAATFNNQRIPMQTCRHCGGEIKDYGGYKDKMNPFGINVSDVWTDIYPVRHKHTKNRKYNELPIKLLDRIISMSTNPGDVVFDPFGGSGTTYAVAQLLGRKWIGIEIGDCSTIKNRLENPKNDMIQLEKVYQEKGRLFTDEALKLRELNGFWNCTSIRANNCTQLTLNDAIYSNNCL